jgi:hypothetical protein
MSTPVVLIAFNRPRVTQRNLEVLRRVAPRQLFLIADGPRADCPDDVRLCGEVRELLGSVDWPCEVRTRYAEGNLGLEANVELGLDWVFAHVDRAIVLEDDCIPDPTFFRYCEELLERYASEPRVWQIAGDNKGVSTALFEGLSYGFAAWASVWGWATWSDRWQAHRAEFDRTHEAAGGRTITAPPRRATAVTLRPEALATRAGLDHFSFVARSTDGDAYGWDHHWWVTIMSRGGLCATPALNLVENDGYSEGATHTRAKKEPTAAVPMPFPLVHPGSVSLTPQVAAELELVMVRTDGRMSRMARKVIRPLWLRAVVRRVLTHPWIWPHLRRLGRRR